MCTRCLFMIPRFTSHKEEQSRRSTSSSEDFATWRGDPTKWEVDVRGERCAESISPRAASSSRGYGTMEYVCGGGVKKPHGMRTNTRREVKVSSFHRSSGVLWYVREICVSWYSGLISCLSALIPTRHEYHLPPFQLVNVMVKLSGGGWPRLDSLRRWRHDSSDAGCPEIPTIEFAGTPAVSEVIPPQSQAWEVNSCA